MLEYQLYYWRESDEEVDFVIARGDSLVAIEVKSGRRQNNTGLSTFRNMYHPQYSLTVGGETMPLDQFFTGNLANLL